MALAIRSMQLGQKDNAMLNLIITLTLAGLFLVIKYFEYSHKIHLGQLPGNLYTFDGIEGTNPHVFFSAYFLMTGLHGIHVIAGMVMITWLIIKTITEAKTFPQAAPINPYPEYKRTKITRTLLSE